MIINLNNGKTESIFKITRGKISQPFINKDYMFIVDVSDFCVNPNLSKSDHFVDNFKMS